MILITRRTCILHSCNYHISLPANSVIRSDIGDLYFAPAVGTWRLVVHPEVGEGGDGSRVGVGLPAGSGSTVLGEDGAETVVAGWELVCGNGEEVRRRGGGCT
jgi:hypothetical protein